MSLFPIFLKLEGRKCVVIGAGKVGAGKAAGLLRASARVVVVGPRATTSIRRGARAGALVWHEREFTPKDIAGAFLAIAATDSSAANEAVYRACSAHGVLCNVVDDPAHCDFFYPAVVRRGPLQVAISTGGRSPALARRLRAELEKQFGPEYEEWVEHVGKMRKELLRQKPSSSERRAQMDQIASPEAFAEFSQSRISARTQARAKKKGRRLPPAEEKKERI